MFKKSNTILGIPTKTAIIGGALVLVGVIMGDRMNITESIPGLDPLLDKLGLPEKKSEQGEV